MNTNEARAVIQIQYIASGSEETPKTGYERPGCHICEQLLSGLIVNGLNEPSARPSVRATWLCLPFQLSLRHTTRNARMLLLYITFDQKVNDTQITLRKKITWILNINF